MDEVRWNDPILQNLLVVVDIVDERVQRVHALAQSPFDGNPLVRSDDAGNNVERKDLFRAGFVPVDVERDAHPEQRLFGRLLVAPDFSVAYRRYSLKQHSGERARRSVRIEHLIVKTAGLVSIKK